MRKRVLLFFESAQLPESMTIAPGCTIWDVPQYVADNMKLLKDDPNHDGVYHNLVEVYHHLNYKEIAD